MVNKEQERNPVVIAFSKELNDHMNLPFFQNCLYGEKKGTLVLIKRNVY